MIPATTPHVAHIGGVRHDVIAWSDSGDALVLDYAVGELKAARTMPGFSSVHPDKSAFAGFVPGGGWMARYTNDDGGTSTEAVVAWALSGTGAGVPLLADSTGLVAPAMAWNGMYPEFFHPDQLGVRRRPAAVGGDAP